MIIRFGRNYSSKLTCKMETIVRPYHFHLLSDQFNVKYLLALIIDFIFFIFVRYCTVSDRDKL